MWAGYRKEKSRLTCGHVDRWKQANYQMSREGRQTEMRLGVGMVERKM